MSKKKLIVMNLAIMIGISSSFAIPSAHAESSNSLSQVQEQRSEVQADIKDADQEVKKIQEEITKLNEQIKRVDEAVAINNKKMDQTKKEIEVANTEISKMEEEIAVLEETIKNRTEILKQRAISYQQSGGSLDYVDVLVGSASFGDFVNRAIAVGKIVEADNTLLEQHEADEKAIKETKATKVKKLADLTTMKAELEGMQALTLEQKGQNDQLKEQLKGEESAKLAAKNSLHLKDSNLASQEASIKQSIEQAQNAQASAVETTSGDNSSSSSSTKNVESNSNSSSSTKNVAANSSSSSSTKNVASNSSSSNSTKSTTTNSDAKKSAATVAATPVNSNGSVKDLISAGYKYIGNSVYVFGGGRNASDVANGRFDCSGFVHWAFSTIGVSVGSTTDSLKHAGTQVSTSNMQPGDLVFFDTYKKDGHVGIYVGGGKFIGSQSSTGVAIANMTSGYWGEKFNGRVVRVNF
jgi:peptidoglycan DL-endopeptidase CwlO